MMNDQNPARPRNHLRAWREFRGLSQAQLASVVGTKGSVISLLESGDRGLSDKWLRRIAPALDVAPSLLLAYAPGDVDRATQELFSHLPDRIAPPVWSHSFGASRNNADAIPDPRVDPGYDIPELWWQIPDEDKPAALAALKALIRRH